MLMLLRDIFMDWDGSFLVTAGPSGRTVRVC